MDDLYVKRFLGSQSLEKYFCLFQTKAIATILGFVLCYMFICFSFLMLCHPNQSFYLSTIGVLQFAKPVLPDPKSFKTSSFLCSSSLPRRWLFMFVSWMTHSFSIATCFVVLNGFFCHVCNFQYYLVMFHWFLDQSLDVSPFCHYQNVLITCWFVSFVSNQLPWSLSHSYVKYLPLVVQHNHLSYIDIMLFILSDFIF